MAPKKEIPVEKRAQIVILHKTGKSYSQIARILKVSKSAISKTLKRKRETGTNTNRKRPGCPRKTTKRIDDKILTISSANRQKSAAEILAEVNANTPAPISLNTVKRRLLEKGMYGRVAVKKPLLRPNNFQKRLDFAERHKDWTVDDWKSVLWTDESRFELFGSKRRQFVRRKVGERYNPKCIVPTVKHGGGSVMVWGCFSYDGIGELVKIEGIMDKTVYHRILQHSAIPSGIGLLGYGFVFQQDNDPKHTSNHCMNYLKNKEEDGTLQILEWPPQSPDINPIELLWDEVDRQVRKVAPTSKADMWTALNDAWGNIQIQTLRKLVERLPKICKAIIKAKGGHFDEKTIN